MSQEEQEEPHQNLQYQSKFYFKIKLMTQKFFGHNMNFNENDLWRDKIEILNLRLSKLPSAKVLLKLEFDSKDQVLFNITNDDEFLLFG